MFTGIVYKYTSPSGKSYIGQTTQSLSDRARFMGEGYKKCTVFYRAIQKYGWDNFSQEILEKIECEDALALKKKLDELEQHYILQFNSLTPNGYNIRQGGEGSEFATDSKVCKTGSEHFNWRKDIDEQAIRQSYLEGNSLEKIGILFDLPKETVKRHLKDQGVLKETHYNRPVVKLDKFGNVLQKWESVSQAEREEGAGRNAIGRCCREHRRPHKGITYRFEGDII